MSRRSARQNTASLSLFPFLAVLICTMGALILVLVALSEHARRQGQAAAAAKTDTSADEARGETEILEWRIEQWQSVKTATQQQLADRRLALAHVEDHTRRLRDEAAELLRATEQIEQTAAGAGQQQSVTRDDLTRLQSQIAEAEAALAERPAVSSAPASYAIIPYQGPSGTRRRPLYIECRADAIILQPEGVVLRENDFQAGLGPGNPLAAALRAAREHLLRQRNSSLGEPGEPYPLLLVRPSGIGSYYVAQAALKSWGSEFGYELIDEEWNVEFWQHNAELAAVEQRAVDEARQRQRLLVAAAPRRFRPGDQPSFRMGGGYRESGIGNRGSGSGYRQGGIEDRESGTGDREGGGGGNPYSGLAGTGGGFGMTPHSGADRDTTGGGSANRQGAKSADNPQPAGEGGIREGTEHTGNVKAAPSDPRSPIPDTRFPSSDPSPNAHSPQYPTTDVSSGPALTAQGDSSGGDSGQPQSMGATVELRPGEFRPKAKSELRSMAERRGANWALPDATDKAFPVARPIRIVCTDEQLTILPDGKGPKAGRSILLGSQTSTAVDELVSEIWGHMRGWGMAGQGLYWKPVLVMEVTPTAGQRYADLRALLSNSGLEIHEKPAGQRTLR
jgi:hypothetical protein